MIEQNTQMNRYMNEQLGVCTVVVKKGQNAMYKDKKGDHYIVSINKTRRLVNESASLSSRIASSDFSIEEIYNIVEELNSSVINIICKDRLFPEYITSCDKYYLYKCKRMTSDWVDSSTTTNNIDTLHDILGIDHKSTQTERISQLLHNLDRNVNLQSMVSDVNLPEDVRNINLKYCLHDADHRPRVHTNRNDYEWYDMECVHVLHALFHAIQHTAH